jgi:hypothetical protein
MKAKHLDTQHIAVLYLEKRLTMAQIASVLGCSAAAICKALHRAGIKAQDATNPLVSCAYCGTEFRRARSRLHATMYCCAEHRYAALERQDYNATRQGGRLTRAIIAQWYDLQAEHIIHYKDSDWRNNDRANLEVYACQADYAAMHQGHRVSPLWAGHATVPAHL